MITMTTRSISIKLLILMPFLAFLAAAPATASADTELLKKSQNPISSLISVPFESNFFFDVGPKDALVYTLNLKPVYPVDLGEFTLINRLIVPITYQEERVSGEGTEFGLGDFTYQGFISPKSSSKVLWGVGPALVVPTATDKRLGGQKWALGPALVALTKPGPWLVGVLISNVTSFAGPSNRRDVKLFSLQYFVNYNLDNGWYLSSTPTITADWKGKSGNKWTVPFGGGVGKLVHFGELPVDFKVQAFGNAENPDGTADWSMQFQMKLLFPKS
jgi:hypothetical protein